MHDQQNIKIPTQVPPVTDAYTYVFCWTVSFVKQKVMLHAAPFNFKHKVFSGILHTVLQFVGYLMSSYKLNVFFAVE